jgi:hypothetical protein
MTCSAEPSVSPRAALREALARPWKATHFRAPGRLAIEPVVERLRERFGGVGKSLPPPTDLLLEAEQKLIASNGDIDDLTARQVRAIPWFLWTSERAWHANARLVVDLLKWAADNWRSAPLRLWSHYLLNLDPVSVASQRCAEWLDQRQDRLPEQLREFSGDWDLFRPGQAIDKLTRALLTDMDVIAQIQGLGIERDKVLKSALILRVLDRLGEVLAKHPVDSEVTKTLDRLLKPLGETPTFQIHGSQDLKQAALKSLVEGLVCWAQQQGEPRITETLDLLHWLIGDPRLHPARWSGIDGDVREIVERWLKDISLNAFFRFMLEMQTDRPDMVEAREAFWRGYQNAISRAWLIVGWQAKNRAKSLLDKSFATFAPGPNVQPDHLSLLLQIGNLVILEMNKTGSTVFWPVTDGLAPKFYQSDYSRSKMLNSCPTTLLPTVERFRMIHDIGWQKKYAAEIKARTGVARA